VIRTSPNADRRLITIGQLAAYAGVTIKAVRHYHKRGLLEEPPRDSSGYRRYSADHAIALIKVKTLAEAGVPLSRIKELLSVDPKRFTAALAEIDRNLQAKAEELVRTRQRIAGLSGGDRLFVSAEVADFLERLVAMGLSRRSVDVEREGWILMQAVSPQEAALWIAEKREALADKEFKAIYLACDAALDWKRDDPRFYKLADRMERWLAKRPAKPKGGHGAARVPTVAQLVGASVSAGSPAMDRLNEIMNERRGSSGRAPERRKTPGH
jgi:DNA-binding transcriptional MerR regulator